MEDFRRAKTARGRRELKKRAPKIHEGEKKGIFMKGATASEKVKQVLIDLCALKKPQSKMLTHRNQVRPFEDAGTIEFLAKANDAACFVFGSHSKKRPHSLVFGRTFDGQLLDMVELQLNPDTFQSMQALASARQSTARQGAKPMFVFAGDGWDASPPLTILRSILLDMFRGEVLAKVNLAALDRVYVVTAALHPTDMDKKCVYFRHYVVAKKRSGTRVPRVELEEAGPRMDLTYNRFTEATAQVKREAMRVHKALRPTRERNVEEGLLGTTLGRVHMEKQRLGEMALAKLKGLGKGLNPNAKRKRDDDDEAEGVEVPAGAAAGGPRPRSTRGSDARDERLGTLAAAAASGGAAGGGALETRDVLMPRSAKKARKLPSAYAISVTSE